MQYDCKKCDRYKKRYPSPAVCASRLLTAPGSGRPVQAAMKAAKLAHFETIFQPDAAAAGQKVALDTAVLCTRAFQIDTNDDFMCI